MAVGGSATSLSKLVGTVLEYETLERAVRVLAGDSSGRRRPPLRARPAPRQAPARRGPPAREVSELLGQPLQIGKGGLREGIILDQLTNGSSNGAPKALAA